MTRKKPKPLREFLGEMAGSLRLIGKHEHNGKCAKVYKDYDWQEYRVKHYTGENHHVDADYHTDDVNDAHDTAKAWVGKSVNEDHLEGEKSSGYQPNRDPVMVKERPGAEARFIAKHMGSRQMPRFTDIDPSTLDDKLFSAVHMKRSVPEGPQNRHGHVPTGQDAKVYEEAKPLPKRPGGKV